MFIKGCYEVCYGRNEGAAPFYPPLTPEAVHFPADVHPMLWQMARRFLPEPTNLPPLSVSAQGLCQRVEHVHGHVLVVDLIGPAGKM